MQNFDDFFKELTSDEQWFELSTMHHKPETFRSVAFKVYVNACADKDTFSVTPIKEHRKHVYNKLVLLPGDKVKKNWVDVALEKVEKEKKGLEEIKATYTKEHADKCAAEALEIIKNSKTINAVPRIPYKQQVEEGDWIPKKPAPYPSTSPNEVYVKERHLAYIKNMYDPRTAQKMPYWIPEEEFNAIYDQDYEDENLK